MLCTKCRLCYHAGNQMLPSGQLNPDFYFVLQNPTAEDMKRTSLDEYCSNEAKLFFSYLRSFGMINNSRFFYLVRCTSFDVEYPSDYLIQVSNGETRFCNSSSRQPTSEELSTCSQYLLSDIAKTKPSIVVAMGKEVTGYLLKRNITQSEFSSYVGKIYETSISGHKVRLVPIHTMKDCYNEYITQEKTLIQRRTIDVLHQLVSMRDGKWVEADKYNKLTYAMSYKEFKDYYDNNLKDEPELAYDIETNAALVYSKEFDIIGFSLAKRHEGVYVCLQSLDHKMSDEDIKSCKELLVCALQNTDKVVVHNSLYEMPATRYNLDYDIPSYKIDDTMVMAKLMLGGTAGAGLKPTAQAIGYPDWETDLSLYIENFSYAMKRLTMASYKEVVKYIRDNPDKHLGSFMQSLKDKYEHYDIDIEAANRQIEETGTGTRQRNKLVSDKEKLGKYIEKLSDVQSISDTYESLLRKYYTDDEEINRLLAMICQKILHGIDYGTPGNVIPYHWIPSKLLTKYGATDSIATLDIKYDFLRQFKEQSTKEVDLYKGYTFMLKEYYAGYCLMMASMHWDDTRAKIDREVYYNIMLRTIKFLFTHKVVQQYVTKDKFNAFLGEVLYENYNDILWETQHRRVGIDKEGRYVHEYLDGDKVRRNAYVHITEIELSPAIRRDCERRITKKILQKVEKATDPREIRSLFNPASTVSDMSELANEALVTPKTRFCVLLKHAGSAKTSEDFNIDTATPEEKEFWSDFDEYKSIDFKTNRMAKEIKFDNLMKKYYLALLPDKSKGLTGKELYNTEVIHFSYEPLQKAVQQAREFQIQRFDDNSQIAIFEAYLESPIDQNDFSTWDLTFKWLFNFRSFKKAAKMVTSYIDGAVGRNNVWEVNKQRFSNGEEVVIREKEYYDTDPEEVIHNPNEDYLYQTNFRVCFTGDTKIPCLDGNDYTFKELVDNKIKELWVYATDENGLTVPAKAINPRLTRRDSELVEVVIDTGEFVRCTPDHEFRLKDGSYRAAKNLVAGDGLLTINNDMTKENRSSQHITEYVKAYNHQVVEVRELSYREDTYDLEVPGYSNFAVCFGKTKVIAHNCSAQSFRWQCLTGDTLIPLKDGRITSLASLYDSGERNFLVESIDVSTGQYTSGICESGVRITGVNVPTLKITLDSGEVIRCTPEHKIMLADGTYKEAQYLTKDDELLNIVD